MTSGEDEMIRFWDMSLNKIAELEVKKVVKTKSWRNSSVQSVDIYTCERTKDITKKDSRTVEPILLVGCRTGEILEAVLNKTEVEVKKG